MTRPRHISNPLLVPTLAFIAHSGWPFRRKVRAAWGAVAAAVTWRWLKGGASTRTRTAINLEHPTTGEVVPVEVELHPLPSWLVLGVCAVVVYAGWLVAFLLLLPPFDLSPVWALVASSCTLLIVSLCVLYREVRRHPDMLTDRKDPR